MNPGDIEKYIFKVIVIITAVLTVLCLIMARDIFPIIAFMYYLVLGYMGLNVFIEHIFKNKQYAPIVKDISSICFCSFYFVFVIAIIILGR